MIRFGAVSYRVSSGILINNQLGKYLFIDHNRDHFMFFGSCLLNMVFYELQLSEQG